MWQKHPLYSWHHTNYIWHHIHCIWHPIYHTCDITAMVSISSHQVYQWYISSNLCMTSDTLYVGYHMHNTWHHIPLYDIKQQCLWHHIHCIVASHPLHMTSHPIYMISPSTVYDHTLTIHLTSWPLSPMASHLQYFDMYHHMYYVLLCELTTQHCIYKHHTHYIWHHLCCLCHASHCINDITPTLCITAKPHMYEILCTT